jgi:hypothetical protein
LLYLKAAVPIDLVTNELVEPENDVSDLLVTLTVRECREPGEVDKRDCHERIRRCGKRGGKGATALAAEPGPLWEVHTACRAVGGSRDLLRRRRPDTCLYVIDFHCCYSPK